MEQAATPVVNPLLDRLRMPGSTFRLPSHGIFYKNGELDESVKNGEVDVFPMTAMEEIILNTPDKLLSGKGIMEVFAHCIPQIVKADQLLSKDVDFLMVALRQVSFGNDMQITYRHTCEHALNRTYTVDLQKMIAETRAIDPTTINEQYVHTLPNGQVVTLKPMTFGNVVQLLNTSAMAQGDADVTEMEAMIIDALASVVSSVEGTTDPAFIREWVTKLPLGWKKRVEQAAQAVTHWGIDFMTKQVCQDCKKPIEIQVSANPVSFFT